MHSILLSKTKCRNQKILLKTAQNRCSLILESAQSRYNSFLKTCSKEVQVMFLNLLKVDTTHF